MIWNKKNLVFRISQSIIQINKKYKKIQCISDYNM